jgi:transcriptional regulator of arginine metabolism
MTKQESRRRLIVEVIGGASIHNQDELQTALERRGVRVTQGTLSRDLKELGIFRIPHADGGYVYALEPPPRTARSDLAREDIGRGIRSIQFSGNLAVIKTSLSYAEPVGLGIDQLQIPEVLGTVSGEDTLLVVLAEGADRERFLAAIRGRDLAAGALDRTADG